MALVAGSTVWLTQSLGASYTVMTDRGHLVRIDGEDADAIGLTPVPKLHRTDDPVVASETEVENEIWDQLKHCFDPEIPVNVVDLGLIYHCGVSPVPEGGYKASVRFTLTAQGCGMGQFLKEDIRNKLLTIPAVREVDVELIWDPPWNQTMMSPSAKQQLGIA
jgi:probable FeS assembly SUF system protein SufT